MINLSFTDNNEELFQEGIIGDALNAANIDTEEIKDRWKSNVVDNIDSARDKVEGFNDTVKKVDEKLKPHKVDNRSIIARARNSVLQFSIYGVQTLRVNEAHIIAKLFERVYTTLVQTVLSQDPYIDEKEANNLVFLKKYHTNINEAVEVFVNKYYEPIDDIDRMICESIFYENRLNENCSVRFSVVPTNDRDLILENTRLMNEPLSGFMYLREADDTETVKETSIKQSSRVLSNDDIRDIAINDMNLSEEKRKLAEKSDKDIESAVNVEMQSSFPKDPGENAPTDDKDKYKEDVKKWNENKRKMILDKLREKQQVNKDIDDKVDDVKEKIKNGKLGSSYQYSNGRFYKIDNSNDNKTTIRPKRKEENKPNAVETAPDVPKILKDSDVKKINGMLPYTVEVSFRIRTEKGGIDRDVRYIIGIKSVLHLIRTQDLADDLQELVTGKIKSLQKVRYKTGEISFKDYFFNVKNLKADAAKRINYNKKWINTLKRLAEYKKLYGSFFKKALTASTGGNIPIPNGTLVLTQPDIVELTNQTGIDLSNVSNAKKLANNLFLIAIVIVDSSAGTMRVLFTDSDNDWDVQSLSSIDAELSKTDNSKLMNELNKLVNK